MGYLTTITINNDALGEFKKYPDEFAEAIFNGINLANRHSEEQSIVFKQYGNYISIQPSRHADDECLYLHSGNCVTNITDRHFKKHLIDKTEWALSFFKRAKNLLKLIDKN